MHHTAWPSNLRSDASAIRCPSDLASRSIAEGKGNLADSRGLVSPLGGDDMLVPRSLVLGDGTVRTFFSLPSGIGSQPLRSEMAMGPLAGVPNAVNIEGLVRRGADPNVGSRQFGMLPQESASGGYLAAIAGYRNDPGGLPPKGDYRKDGVTIGNPNDLGLIPPETESFPIAERNASIRVPSLWSGHARLVEPSLILPSCIQRPYSPFRGIPPPRVVSGTPYMDVQSLMLGGPDRETHYSSKSPHREAVHVNVSRREGSLSPFESDRSSRGFVESRWRTVSPRIHESMTTGGLYAEQVMNSHGENWMAYKENLLLEPLDRLHPLMYRRDISSLRDGQIPAYKRNLREDLGRVVTHARSSGQQDSTIDPGSEAFLTRRRLMYGQVMEDYKSPERAQRLKVSDRMQAHESALENSDMQFDDVRRDLKRKYMEQPKEVREDGWLVYPDDLEFQRQRKEIDHRASYGFLSSGRYRREQFPERTYQFRSHSEREEMDYAVRQPFEQRSQGESGSLPLRLGGRASHFPEMGSDYVYSDRKYYDMAYESQKISAANEEGRPWDDQQVHDEFCPEDKQQMNVPDFPENSKEFIQQTNRACLKFSKILNENAVKRKRYEDQGKSGTLLCLVCNRFSSPFPDTHSLVMHAYNCKKQGLHAEHVGLYKALCILMGWSTAQEPDDSKSYQRISSAEAMSNKEDLILWPPVVIVHNACTGKGSDGKQEGIRNPEMDELLRELGHKDGKAKAVYGRQGHCGIILVKYLATHPSLQEAERLHQHFESHGRGRKDWIRVLPNLKEPGCSEEGPDFVHLDEQTKEEKRVLYGYLALAGDFDKVDLDTRRRCFVRSRQEIKTFTVDTIEKG
eukprot:c27870_g1_i1 orf=168-2726(+)